MPVNPTRDRLIAERRRQKAMPPRDYLYRLLCATHTHAEADDLLNRLEKGIREQASSEIETRLFSIVKGDDPAREDALETAALIVLTGDPYAEPSRT